MIQEEKPAESSTDNVDTFLDQLVWREGPKNKWYLDKRECNVVEIPSVPEPQVISFDMNGYDFTKLDERKINSGDRVIAEQGKMKVNKIEENQVFIQKEEEEAVPVPMESVTKFININFYIIGKTRIHLLEKIEFNINSTVDSIKNVLADYLVLPSTIIDVYLKDTKLEGSPYIYTLDINANDFLYVSFPEGKESIYKRSSSKDYSWYDQKNLIPFVVNKNIIVNAIGFYKHTDSSPAVYDFFLYEVTETGDKSQIMSLTNVKVMPTEVDGNNVKKVTCTPFMVKADVTYKAYVYFKISDMRTYYAYSGTEDQTVDGVRFRMLNLSEEGHRSSTTSGHMPYLYFKLQNPYEE